MKKLKRNLTNMNMKKIIPVIIIVTALVATGVLTTCFPDTLGTNAYSNTTKKEKDVKNQLQDVKDDQKEIKEEKKEVAGNIRELEKRVNNLIDQYNVTIKEIENTEANIKKKQKEMEAREENLNERLAVMYKNGSVGFIDVLMGSSSVSEFVSNVEIIKKIYRNDMKVLKLLKQEYENLKIAKEELKKKKEKLADQKKELAEEKKKLDSKKKELEKAEDDLKATADKLTTELKAMMDAKSEYVGGALGWPVPASHYISSPFGNRLHPILKIWKLHTGIDIAGSVGLDIVAAGSGTVIYSGGFGGYGNCLMIDHGGGIATLYGHCSQLLVGNGAKVKKGQVVAKVGNSGVSTGPHLHFEVRKNGAYVNPLGYLK